MKLQSPGRPAAALGIGSALVVAACTGATAPDRAIPSPPPPPAVPGAPSGAPTNPALPGEPLGRDRSPAQAREPAPGPARPPLQDEDIAWERTPVMRLLGTIARDATDTKYLHTTIVDPSRGIYYFDCSGMVAWVLRRAAPLAYVQVAHGLGDRRPVSSTFEAAIRRAPADAARGWRRVERVADAQPGDVIAWVKPPVVRSANTGHIGFVVLPPREWTDEGFVAAWGPEGEQQWIELGGEARAYLVRIADATRLHHLDDTRQEGNRSGFGFGTILVVSDAAGAPVAYGWVGPHGNVFSTNISLGRPLS